MLVERRALAQERRIVPETVARFSTTGAKEVGFAAYACSKTSSAHSTSASSQSSFTSRRAAKDWKLAGLREAYDVFVSTGRTSEADARLEWVTPVIHCLKRPSSSLGTDTTAVRRGAMFFELGAGATALLEIFIASSCRRHSADPASPHLFSSKPSGRLPPTSRSQLLARSDHPRKNAANSSQTCQR